MGGLDCEATGLSTADGATTSDSDVTMPAVIRPAVIDAIAIPSSPQPEVPEIQ
jgi:hypothetical protein